MIILACLLVLTVGSFAQDASTSTGNESKRISFFTGIGASYISKKLYGDPIINPLTGNVELQRFGRVKSNLAIGIAYTARSRTVKRYLQTLALEDGPADQQEVKVLQKGFTIITFINPVLLSKGTESQGFFNMTDFGIGLGHTFPGGFLIVGTAELFWVRQPRAWFVNEFRNSDRQYMVANEVQHTVDLTDNNIFMSRPVVTFGIKICYSFENIKRFIETTPAAAPAVAPRVPPSLKRNLIPLQ